MLACGRVAARETPSAGGGDFSVVGALKWVEEHIVVLITNKLEHCLLSVAVVHAHIVVAVSLDFLAWHLAASLQKVGARRQLAHLQRASGMRVNILGNLLRLGIGGVPGGVGSCLGVVEVAVRWVVVVRSRVVAVMVGAAEMGSVTYIG